MIRLPSRQVHLDFHTSEAIPGVGSKFDPKQFQQALQAGRLNSITVFAKCHHGWSYYPTQAGTMHPTLDFDLTGAMIDAAHEIGVRAPVYITVGWSVKDAADHPEWVARERDGSPVGRNKNAPLDPNAPLPYTSWTFLCPGTGYGDLVRAQTREVCERYAQLDGIFFDINFRPRCWCATCLAGMKAQGLDPDKDEDVVRYNIEVWCSFALSCNAIIRERHPEATIFYNGSAGFRSQHYHGLNTHFELEDLPTTWGGYDKMPLRARFFARTGRDYLGMTGKFHASWGEFGGFKNPEALRFECAWMLANGARCSVGDQLHPVGRMDMGTYRLIGHAYDYVERIEEWCYDVEETTRLGVMLSGEGKSDEGMAKMLMEAQLDFDVALPGDDLGRFDALVLPDDVRLNETEAAWLRRFVVDGGAVVATGASGLNRGGTEMLLDVGAKYMGTGMFENDFVAVTPALARGLVRSPVLCYQPAHRVRVTDGTVLAHVHEPYFNRTRAHFCSPRNTPNRSERADHPAAVRKGGVVYLAHPVCRLYHEFGMQFYRDYFLNALRLVYTDPVLDVAMPSSGRARLVQQRAKRRYVLHLLYATPIQRGIAQVLEDMPSLARVKVSARIAEPITAAYLAPDRKPVPFTQHDGRLTLTVRKVQCHQAVVWEY